MKRTAREIAEAIGAQVEGNADRALDGVAGPESAGPTDLIFVGSAKHLERARNSRAECVLLAPGLTLPGKILLRTPHPKLAFAQAAALLCLEQAIAVDIHPAAVISVRARLAKDVAVGPYAVIEDDVEIGAGAQIGAGCFLGRGSQLGEGCRLHPRVTLYAGVRLGRRVILHSGVVIGSDGFGFVRGPEGNVKFPQLGGVEIGDDVEIGSNTTIDRGSLGTTRIARGVKIDNLVQIGHNVEIGDNTVIAAQTGISGSCKIGEDVLIGGQVGIGDGATIEDGAIVGGQTGILPGKIIRAGKTVWGTPARTLDKFRQQHAWLATQAAKRRGEAGKE